MKVKSILFCNIQLLLARFESLCALLHKHTGRRVGMKKCKKQFYDVFQYECSTNSVLAIFFFIWLNLSWVSPQQSNLKLFSSKTIYFYFFKEVLNRFALFHFGFWWEKIKLKCWGDWNRLAASLVEAGPSDVAHPFDDVMIGVVQLGLEHLKISKNVNESKGDGNRFYFV
jgi:hypothetical protein